MVRLLLLLLLAAAPAAAQTFERFGVRDGLPSELVHDLAVGPDGALWIGTDDGLARYDGHGFRVWRSDAERPGSLPTSLVFAVAPVEGGVWLGTARGLAFLDLRTGRARAIAAVPRVPVRDVVRDAAGRLWLGTGTRGLWRYDPASGEGRRARLAPAGAPEPRRTVVVAADGPDVWVELASDQQADALLCRLDVERAACADAPLGAGWRLLEDEGRAVLARIEVPSGTGELRWLAEGERWSIPGGTLDASFRSVLRLGEQRAWLRTSGLARVEPGAPAAPIQAAPSRRGGLGGFDARALARDRQGNVWVGTEAGLYLARRPSGPFQTFTSIPGDAGTLSDNRVNGMAQDAEGRLWVATNDGLNRLDLGTGRATRLDAALTSADAVMTATERAFWQVLPQPDRVLIGSKRGGIAELRGGRLRSLDLPDKHGYVGVRSLVAGPDGRIWAGTRAALLRTGATGAFEPVALPDGAAPVNVVYADADGATWLGTDAGLYRQRPGGWDRVAEEALCAPVVWSMAESDADPGALWVATVDGGLGRLDRATGAVECLTVRDGLPTNSVYGVLADDHGALWASTTSGLARVDLATRGVVTYTSADGLAGDGFNLMAQLRLADGRLAFGGPGGLTVVDPSVRTARGAPAVAITGVERQGRLLPGVPASGAALRLAHDQSAFGVRFSVMDFRAPRRSRYRYRLVGLDADWQRTDGAAPRAAYSGVPPGRYRFEVQGAAAGSLFSERAAVLTVEVVPAWWQRRGLQALVALGVLAAAAAGWRGRRRRLALRTARRQRDAAEVRRRLASARERERASLARDLHDGPVQTLYRVGHDLDALGAPTTEPVRARVDAVAAELRQMMSELRPSLVEHLGLGAALRTLGRRAEDRFPDLTVDVDAGARAVPDAAAGLALFRIAQEALHNAGRHAGAARVAVELRDDGDALRLTVRDDGRGFVPEDPVALARAQHFGLIGARERAEAVGGELVVASAPGVGTTVTARVPHGAGAQTVP